MSLPEIAIEDFTPEAKPAHEYRPHVLALIEAGPDKVATVVTETEEDAKAFIRAMQKAAGELDKSARKRDLHKTENGWRVSVSVGDKITRSRKPADSATAPAEPDSAPDAAPAKTAKK